MQPIDFFHSRKSCLMTSVKLSGYKFVNQFTNQFHFSVENSITSLANKYIVQSCTSTILLEPKKIKHYWLLHSDISLKL